MLYYIKHVMLYSDLIDYSGPMPIASDIFNQIITK